MKNEYSIEVVINHPMDVEKNIATIKISGANDCTPEEHISQMEAVRDMSVQASKNLPKLLGPFAKLLAKAMKYAK